MLSIPPADGVEVSVGQGQAVLGEVAGDLGEDLPGRAHLAPFATPTSIDQKGSFPPACGIPGVCRSTLLTIQTSARSRPSNRAMCQEVVVSFSSPATPAGS
jgi:hypothetical protein